MYRVSLLLCLCLPAAIYGSIFRQSAQYQAPNTYYGSALDYYGQYFNQAPQYYQQRAYDNNQERSSYIENPNNAAKEYVWFADPNAPEKTHAQADRINRMRNPENYYNHADPITWKLLSMAAGPQGLVENQKDMEKLYGDAYRTLQRVSSEDQTEFHNTMSLSANNEDAYLNATELLNKYKYAAEEHTVKTDDGYYLKVIRIVPRQRNPKIQKNEVVFLMHGIAGSADDWLLMGPGMSLAYLLADEGYDVYLGNARGNKYSRRHASKHPSQDDFWQFSADDIALHDMPAMIDYALENSNQDKLYYVGHSLGNNYLFALIAARPEYNDKIEKMLAMAPMTYMTNVRSPLLKMMAPNSPVYNSAIRQLGNGEFAPSKEILHYAGGELCEKAIGCKNVCSNAMFVMSGFNLEQVNVKTVPVAMGHMPAGISVQVMKHVGQMVISNEFRKYDYGADVNILKYGDKVPPRYELENVNVPVALYYSESDWLAHPSDVRELQRQLSTVVEMNEVNDKHFGHIDFQISANAPEYVYKKIINAIQSRDDKKPSGDQSNESNNN